MFKLTDNFVKKCLLSFVSLIYIPCGGECKMTNRKRIFCTVIFFAVLLITSCNPVPEKTEIGYQPMQTDGCNITMDTSHPRYLTVSFDVIKGAISYDLRVFTDNGSFDRTYHVNLKRNSSNGKLSVMVTGISDGQEYRASLTVKDREGSVITYTPARSWLKEIMPEKPLITLNNKLKTRPDEGTLLPSFKIQF